MHGHPYDYTVKPQFKVNAAEAETVEHYQWMQIRGHCLVTKTRNTGNTNSDNNDTLDKLGLADKGETNSPMTTTAHGQTHARS